MINYPPEIKAKVPKSILKLLPMQDSAVKVRNSLRKAFKPAMVAGETDQRWAWEQCGILYQQFGRLHEAIFIFESLYEQMLQHQIQARQRVHKGVPLFWLYDCHHQVGNPVLAKRYLMLALAEDAITDKGRIIPAKTGTYHRCIWNGMSEGKFQEYAAHIWGLATKHKLEVRFPEWLLQEVDQDWMTDQPSQSESLLCPVNPLFVSFLLDGLGKSKGESLERVAHYLLSCIAGCRARMRLRSRSTEYDVLGIVEGTFTDFRSEVGRYFLCECKDWIKPANFSTLAKFCRLLDSTKTKFGILFSKKGITGTARTTDAERELLKVFQDRGVVIIVITETNLKQLVQGANFITMLREKYEQVRFDLTSAPQ